MDRLTLLKIFGLITGCAAKFVTGSLFVFNVYQNDIKDTFNYTQKEVEAMSSLLNVGLGIGFVPGMFYDRFGPGWTSAVGLFISMTSYLLIWSTTRSVKFYSSNSWLVVIYFLFCGFGSVFTYMVALNTNIINFDKKHTGKIVGLLNAFFAGSPSVYSVIYYNLFPESTSVAVARSNLAGVMLMFAVSFVVVDVMCILFLRKYNDPFAFESMETDQSESDVTESTDKRQDMTYSVYYDSISIPKDTVSKVSRNLADKPCTSRQAIPNLKDTPLTIKQILLNIDYQIFIVFITCATTVGLVFFNNITVISKSLKLDDNDKYLTIVIPITSTLVSAGVGLLSDLVIHKISRNWFLIFASLNMFVSQIFAVIWAEKLGLLILATSMVGMSIGILWSVGPTVLKEMYFIGNLGRNWGITILIAGLLGFCAQEIFGALYDDEIDIPGSTYCFGMKCIRGGLGLTISLALLSSVFGILSQVRKYCTPRQ